MKPYTILKTEKLLLISIQEEIDDNHLCLLLQELGDIIKSNKARGVIIDLHQVEIIDTFFAENIKKLALMLKAFNASAVVAGITVGAVMSLIDFNIDLQGVEFALDIEDAALKLILTDG